MKKYITIIISLVLLFLLGCVSLKLINSYFGWYGYKPWEYRMCTRGDINEAVERKVFIKNLNYKCYSTIDPEDFRIFIEKGYWYGFKSSAITDFHKSEYPYQVSLRQSDTVNNIYYQIINVKDFDSINNKMLSIIVHLREPHLKDTLYLKIVKFDRTRDSLGYIKVWD